ncbi:RICIN domain-containing protein [Neolewinella lacunae]|uniref:RICIN domain-containing protein n=1 Tax=Neolewinella lacunae TaxID=1517758 RepID=A0A923PFU5_9BACT|nr:RICIN domain-containing protein [Neolewinella lacunae]MBC6993353.1 RICIN domain-containing protein [Neolewinella lacunae]MDN3636343.1 RICIN domain-containing protein [Neolewinella lacunae]
MQTTFSIRFSAVLFAVVILFGSAWAAPDPSPVQEGVFFLKARHSGKFLSVKNAGQENGAPLWQWDFHGKAQQQFEFTSAGDGYFFIKAVHSGKYLSVKNAGQENGALLWQWDFHGKAQQQFALEPAEGNAYYIKARHSGKYLSIKDAGKENEAILWQWDFHGKAQQQFEMVAVTSAASVDWNDDPLPANVRPANPQYHSFTVTNKSMWDVSFRVLFNGAKDWTSWTDLKAGLNASTAYLTGEANQTIRDYEIQWKDIMAWKQFPGGMPIIPDNSSMHVTISGNTLTGIKID